MEKTSTLFGITMAQINPYDDTVRHVTAIKEKLHYKISNYEIYI